MRIVVAEDDPDTRDFMSLMLTNAGYAVEAHANGALAWEALKRDHCPLLLVDCMMPHLDGFELCRKIRSTPRPIYTYIIMLTAFGGRENYLKGMEAGADDFLTKPCDLEELRARLQVARRILNLQEEVRQLSGLLPICTYCKKIREGEEEWVPIETYVARRTEASFSHGICPDCFDGRIKPELARMKRSS
jgi:sigma-B regulation protein RsbU (phosphoserine phosphatase)